MKPNIIEGNCYIDQRGKLFYNNDFDTSSIKRIYMIENINVDFIRAWQGHKIEQRWFSVFQGSFEIQLIAIDDWEKPTINLQRHKFILNTDKLSVLHIPRGYVSSIQALKEASKLLVMADYLLGEIDDEFRYSFDYFK
jgi:dTDP-4-dehydrorhamnose 3,5-epimerase-like enzyme